jgi:hypothetical protein
LDVPTTEDSNEYCDQLGFEISDVWGKRGGGAPATQVLEFAAKTFIANEKFTIGSPLYVAELDGRTLSGQSSI